MHQKPMLFGAWVFLIMKLAELSESVINKTSPLPQVPD